MSMRRNDGMILAAALLFCGSAAAQVSEPPALLPPLRAVMPIEDPAVEPAQYARPAGSPAVLPAPAARGLPPQPPTPVVQLALLVPQDVAPKADITYTIRLANTTAANAHLVKVRMPIPDGTQFVKSEPRPDAGDPTKQNSNIEWHFKTIEANGTQTIQVTVRPLESTRDVEARAYVSFEHGQQVRTRINAPKLKVRTEAPKQAVVGQAIPVRATVTNDGRVPIQNVKLTANISQGFEFDRDAGGERTKNPLQRVFEIGTLPPGGSRLVSYSVVAREVKELVVQSAVDGSHQAQVSDEAKTAVKEAKIKVELMGTGLVEPGQDAQYEAVIRNTGSLPLTNVRITALIPDGCKATGMTNGGRESRDRIVWVVPRMPPDDRPYSVRWRLAATESGRKSVRAEAIAVQGVEGSQAVETVFRGAAALHWDTSFDQPTVPVDRSGMMTVSVKNSGSEPAKNVRVEVGVPQEVKLIRATPGGREQPGKVVFDARDIPPGKLIEYSLQFRGEQPGQAHFQPVLFADVLGAEPLRTNKYVEILRR